MFTHGLTVECIQEDSIMVSNMVRDHIGKLAGRRYTVSGKKEKRPKYVKTTRNSNL